MTSYCYEKQSFYIRSTIQEYVENSIYLIKGFFTILYGMKFERIMFLDIFSDVVRKYGIPNGFFDRR
jgi:hypothetical protein